MNTITKNRLIREFKKNATDMVDIEYLGKIISEGYDTNVREGDIVISTRYYDGGIFAIDPRYTVRRRQETTRDTSGNKHTRYYFENDKPITNPYEETVCDNDIGARLASLSIKCREGDPHSRTELRIKVKKLSLLSWDETTNSYPRISGDIIFRQRDMDFSQQYRTKLDYYVSLLKEKPDWVIDQLEDVERYADILKKLISVPAFKCFWDDKYGFLIKRQINVTRIVMSNPITQYNSGDNHRNAEADIGNSILADVSKNVKQNVEDFKAHLKNRESEEAEFKEQVVAKALHPDRVEKIIEKHGIDGLEKWFGE